MLKLQAVITSSFFAIFLSANAVAQNAVIVNGKAIPKSQLDK
jgi:peptidyl-prolyl cis-trans isomerase C